MTWHPSSQPRLTGFRRELLSPHYLSSAFLPSRGLPPFGGSCGGEMVAVSSCGGDVPGVTFHSALVSVLIFFSSGSGSAKALQLLRTLGRALIRGRTLLGVNGSRSLSGNYRGRRCLIVSHSRLLGSRAVLLFAKREGPLSPLLLLGDRGGKFFPPLQYNPPPWAPRVSRPPTEELLPGPSGLQPPVIITPSRVRLTLVSYPFTFSLFDSFGRLRSRGFCFPPRGGSRGPPAGRGPRLPAPWGTLADSHFMEQGSNVDLPLLFSSAHSLRRSYVFLPFGGRS
jgi:hypothetical protein